MTGADILVAGGYGVDTARLSQALHRSAEILRATDASVRRREVGDPRAPS